MASYKRIKTAQCISLKDNIQTYIAWFLFIVTAFLLLFAKPVLSCALPSLALQYSYSFPNHDLIVPSSAQIYPSYPATTDRGLEPALG